MSRRVLAIGGPRLVKALVGWCAIGLVAATVALAASLTMGNAAVDRPSLDIFRNFIVVDQSNSADADGLLKRIRYYAKLSAARDQGGVAFAIVRGDQATGFRVIWISENIAKPASSGVRSLAPATPIPVKAEDNLAIYFEKQGLVPHTLVDETDPQLWEFWQPNNSGKPAIGSTLVLADPLGTGVQRRRNYSVEGWTTDCTFRVKRPIRADGSSVFRRRGVIPVKLKPSCGDRKLAPTIKITYTGEAPAGPNETVSSVGSANTGATMRWAGGHYHYNLAVKGKAPGQYRLSFNIAGVEAASVVFTLRGGAFGRGVGQRGTPGKSDHREKPGKSGHREKPGKPDKHRPSR
jgi:hypothetical protein